MKTDNRQKLLYILTAAVVALFAGDRLVYTPLSKLWDRRALDIRTLRSNITEAKALIKQEQSYQRRWSEMRTNALPDNQSVAFEQVSKAFHDWAEESSVTLRGVAPQWKNDTEDHKTVVCRVDAQGTLWMLARFIYDIEKDPMGLKVESVDFSSRDNTGQDLSLGLQVSGLVLTQPSQ
jgi:hypothetical protein